MDIPSQSSDNSWYSFPPTSIVSALLNVMPMNLHSFISKSEALFVNSLLAKSYPPVKIRTESFKAFFSSLIESAEYVTHIGP